MAALKEIEVWENNLEGRVSITVTDGRGRDRQLSIKGKGQRLRLSADDREVAEEQIRYPHNNPFTNGTLTQVGGAKSESVVTDQQLSDDDLAGLFELSDAPDFIAAINDLSEVNVRRLKDMVKEKGSVMQSEALVDYIEEKWPASSGDTKTWRDINADPADA